MRRARRTIWGLADQVISSLTNFALAIVVARVASREQFGAFALVFAGYLVIVGIGQGLSSAPMSIRYSAARGAVFREAARRAAGASLVLGIVSGVTLTLVALVSAATLRGPLLVVALLLPGLTLQDSWRHIFVAQGRASQALLNDGIWALCQAIGFIVVLAGARPSVTSLLAVWGLAAAVAAGVGCVQLRVAPSVRGIVGWLSEHHRLITRYTAESIILRGATQLALVSVAAITGVGAVGSLRGAQVLYSPLNSLFLGGLFVGVPEGVRTVASTPGRLKVLVNRVSLGMVLLTLVWTMCLLFVPASVGSQLLGATWVGAYAILLPVGFQYLFIALSMGPQVGLKSVAAANETVVCQIAYAVFILVGAATGAFVDGITGAAVGMTAGTGLGLLVWWALFGTARRAMEASPVGARAAVD